MAHRYPPDPLYADPDSIDDRYPPDQVIRSLAPPRCRVCDGPAGHSHAPDEPPCEWTVDPLSLGPLCSYCLAIAVSVTDQDAEAMGAYDPRFDVRGTFLFSTELVFGVAFTLGLATGILAAWFALR